jgi:hypothetical protein
MEVDWAPQRVQHQLLLVVLEVVDVVPPPVEQVQLLKHLQKLLG